MSGISTQSDDFWSNLNKESNFHRKKRNPVKNSATSQIPTQNEDFRLQIQ